MTDLAQGMRDGMRRVAQGVTVVSLVQQDGERGAMTASSVTSVSADPASMLVCVHRDSSLHTALSESQPFCINVLTTGMEEIANLCAGQATGEGRFAIGDWRADPKTGLPYLHDALANFYCAPDAVLSYGTHLICVGKLSGVRLPDSDASPLLYLDGHYRSFGT